MPKAVAGFIVQRDGVFHCCRRIINHSGSVGTWREAENLIRSGEEVSMYYANLLCFEGPSR